MECWKSRLLPFCRVVTLPAAKVHDQHREELPCERLLQFRTQTVSRLEVTIAPSLDNRRAPIRCKHLAKKSRLPGCVLRVAKIAQNNADEAKTLTWVQANAFSKG